MKYLNVLWWDFLTTLRIKKAVPLYRTKDLAHAMGIIKEATDRVWYDIYDAADLETRATVAKFLKHSKEYLESMHSHAFQEEDKERQREAARKEREFRQRIGA